MDKHSDVLNRGDVGLWLHLVAEDKWEDTYEVAPDDRLSCHTHQQWVTECTPLHQSTPLY